MQLSKVISPHVLLHNTWEARLSREIQLIPALYTKYDDLWLCGYHYSDLFLYYVAAYVKFGTPIICAETAFGGGRGGGLAWGAVAASIARPCYWHNQIDTPSLHWKWYFCLMWHPLGVSFLIFYGWFVYLHWILYFSRLVNDGAIKSQQPYLGASQHVRCTVHQRNTIDTNLIH